MAAERVYTAKALLLNPENKILVLRSSKWDARPDRSHKPDFPGGIVEEGETPTVGLVREVSEEAGIAIAESDLVLLYTETKFHQVTHDSVTKHLFFARTETSDVTLSWEHEAYEWLDFESVLTLEWRPFHQDALDYIKLHSLLDEFTS